MRDNRFITMSAFMNKEVYKSPSDRTKRILGYDLVENNTEWCVYVNHPMKHLFFVMRGTASVKDVATDTLLALGHGEKSLRFRNALKTYDDIERKYPNYRITVTGHSLAGFLSSRLAKHRKSVTQSIAFNEGVGLDGQYKSRKTLSVRNRGDLVSLLGKNNASITLDDTKGNPLKRHSMESFIPANATM